jgi:excisionase family DNA binding protein
MDNNSLMTASEIASKLNISRSLAFQLMKKGEIRTVRFGRCVRVLPDDLTDFIKRNTSGIPIGSARNPF